MRSSSPIHDLVEHVVSGHCHRCLCHTRWVGRPKHGRSTRTTTGRSFTWANTAQPAQPGRPRPALDVDAQRFTNNIVDTEDVHFRQADQQLAHARRIRFHRGSPSEGVRDRQTGRAPATRSGCLHPTQIRRVGRVGLSPPKDSSSRWSRRWNCANHLAAVSNLRADPNLMPYPAASGVEKPCSK